MNLNTSVMWKKTGFRKLWNWHKKDNHQSVKRFLDFKIICRYSSFRQIDRLSFLIPQINILHTKILFRVPGYRSFYFLTKPLFRTFVCTISIRSEPQVYLLIIQMNNTFIISFLSLYGWATKLLKYWQIIYMYRTVHSSYNVLKDL